MKSITYSFLKPLPLLIVTVFLLLNIQANAQGTSISLDRSQNDYVLRADHSGLPTGSSARTVELWFKIHPDHVGFAYLIHYGVHATNTSFVFHTIGTNGLAMDFGGFGPSFSFAGQDFLDGNWHHAAISYSGGFANATSVKAYLNGIEGTVSGGSFTFPNTSTSGGIAVGTHQSILANSVDGDIDEVRIWNVARSQSDIQSTMNSELVGNEAGLVSYYNFNEGIPCDDNTGLTMVPDLVGSNDLSFVNLNLTGNTSNFQTGFGLEACDGPEVAVPTMGEWALITFALIIMSLAVVTIMQWQKRMHKNHQVVISEIQ